MTKRGLLEALRASRDEVLRIVRALPAERLEEGRYENGWNGRQILAHIASIEWSYPRLIDIARDAAVASAGARRDAGGRPPDPTMRGGNDAYNDRQVAKRAHLSVADLLDEFERNRAATIAAVEAADERALRPAHPLGRRRRRAPGRGVPSGRGPARPRSRARHLRLIRQELVGLK